MRHLAALPLGSAVALAAVLVHRSGLLVLALAVVTSLVTAAALRRGTRPSLASAFCLGWVAMLGLVLAGRPEGDWAIGSDLAGYTLMGTALAMIALGVAGLSGRGSPGRT